MKTTIKLKRVYEEPEKYDGIRILVDRLWPRGMTKEKAALDLWLKDIAPSNELRKWFAHDPAKWGGFRERYREELSGNPEPVAILAGELKKGTVTLLYGARDQQHNEAQVLKEWIQKA
jgi:uncharacterized protein YeaO (DUF488 family)